ncbi:MAG: EscU/YscU/HrcU family type III secretion system export apparatus switch protein [Pseudomonadales bacterium]|jgi:flagellar biosynthesis protein
MKKPLQAIAIEYGNNEAPVVVAKGKDEFAQQIIDAALAAGVPIKKDEELAALLSLLDIDEHIPRSLYTLVAEVLVYTYWLKGMKPGDEKTV